MKQINTQPTLITNGGDDDLQTKIGCLRLGRRLCMTKWQICGCRRNGEQPFFVIFRGVLAAFFVECDSQADNIFP
jgi:hypothetical protein